MAPAGVERDRGSPLRAIHRRLDRHGMAAAAGIAKIITDAGE
jgi:hypothetical protein